MSFLGWLTLLFVAFKLIGLIHWSWWAVLAPLWMPWVFILIPYTIYIASKGK